MADDLPAHASTGPVDSPQSRNVVALDWVAFFGGLAQDMIQPILPLFYAWVLGLNKELIGLIEGSLMTGVSLMKIDAGYISDAWQAVVVPGLRPLTVAARTVKGPSYGA